MASGNESTTRFRVDITDLKKGMQEAQRAVRLANSEFKAATSGMDDWGSSADGLSAKVKQLDSVLDAQKRQLSSLEEQYRLVAEEQGENSRGAQELMIRINNQKAAINRTESDLQKYSQRLDDCRNGTGEFATETQQAATATDRLKQTISDQESELAKLKQKYADVALEQGKNSAEAQELAGKIGQLSTDLRNNRSALQDAEGAADDLDNSLDDVGEAAAQTDGGFTVMKGALSNLVADGIRFAIDALKEMAVECDQAYNSFQAQTGASAEEMGKFKKEMDDLYQNNYGESLQDVGDKMAYIKQVTGEVDPTKIKDLTENAIALEDTFGSDFNETVRGVNNLMKHFGVDSQTAFDLFAKGSQLGLDYTDELGDNITEYGGNFQQAGYSAEEYFQLLVNGSKGGAYNLDKVNDSINEVKNRLADGSIESTMSKVDEKTGKVVEGTAKWSGETESLFKQWQNGETTQKAVIDSIVSDINNCTNEQDALTMAAAAFGTMGEDANLKVVKSLVSTGDSFKEVGGTMNDIKKIKYDDVGSQLTSLGRKAKQELLQPFLKEILPGIKQFVEYCIENFDSIIPVIESVGTALLIAFAVKKIADFTGAISNLFTVISLNPIGALITAVGALGVAMSAYFLTEDKIFQKSLELSDTQKGLIDEVGELKESYDQMEQTRRDSFGGIDAEYGKISDLKDELNGLIDSNGQVKQGEEDRANFIVNELAGALGLEKDQIWEIINSNGQLGESIDQLIEKKKAEATLAASEAAYTQAIKERDSALQTYQQSVDAVTEAEAKREEKENALIAVKQKMEEAERKGLDAIKLYSGELGKAQKEYDASEQNLSDLNDAMHDAESTYVGYNATIQNYEGLSSAIISGDAGKIAEAMKNMQNNFVTAETGTKKSLQNQVTNMQGNLNALKRAVENGTPGITQEMIDAAQQMVNKSVAELDKFKEKGAKSGTAGMEAVTTGFRTGIPKGEEAALEYSQTLSNALNSKDFTMEGWMLGNDFDTGLETKKPEIDTTSKEIADGVDTNLGSPDTGATGQKQILNFNQSLTDGKLNTDATSLLIGGDVDTNLGLPNTRMTGAKQTNAFNTGLGDNRQNISYTSKGLSDTTNSGLGSADTQKTGRSMTADYNKGVGGVGTKATGKGRADEANDGLASVSAYDTGDNFTGGFSNGMSSGSWAQKLWDAAWNLGKKALGALSAAIQEGSPSKLTTKSGEFFGIGFVNGIAGMAKEVAKAARELGETAMEELDGSIATNSMSLDVKAGRTILQSNAYEQKLAKYRKHEVTETSRKAAVQNYYFNQTNNSPKALPRKEIYRNTKNLISQIKAVKA